MFGIFEKLQDIAQRLGVVTEAHMYPSGLIVIEGKTGDGGTFRVNVTTEHKKDGAADGD